jgi:hypothetical protein
LLHPQLALLAGADDRDLVDQAVRQRRRRARPVTRGPALTDFAGGILEAAPGKELVVHGKKLDLSAVVYSKQLHPAIKGHLEATDIVYFWTWNAKDLINMEANFATYRKIAPTKRTLLGIYMWDFGDGNTSIEPFPTNIYEIAGTYTICLTVSGNGCTGITCITFTVTPEGDFLPGGMPMTGFTLNVVSAIPNSVNEAAVAANLSVFPNPVSTSSVVRWEGMPNGAGRMDVISLDGRVVFTTNLNQLGGKQQFNLPTEQLNQGIYNVRISSANGFSKSIQVVK